MDEKSRYKNFQMLSCHLKQCLLFLFHHYRENGVDEANESDCHAIVKYFDSTQAGLLHFNDYLQLLMPCDEPALRAEIA